MKVCKCVFDILFFVDVCGDDVVVILVVEVKCVVSEFVCEVLWFYVCEIVDGIIDQCDEIDEQIMMYSRDWKLEWMFVVDCVLLCIVVWEIFYNDEVLMVVVIDEVVEFVKEFLIDDFGVFVYGVFVWVVCVV